MKNEQAKKTWGPARLFAFLYREMVHALDEAYDKRRDVSRIAWK
jgi:hypothetical protein